MESRLNPRWEKIKAQPSKQPLYVAWYAMHRRCESPSEPSYKNYGARGISVCDEWKDFEPFEQWARSNGFREGLTIDRIDNDGDYCPENCRWATRGQQQNNRRGNVLREWRGETKTVTEWGRDPRCVVAQRALCKRIRRGWSMERAMTHPPMENQYVERRN